MFIRRKDIPCKGTKLDLIPCDKPDLFVPWRHTGPRLNGKNFISKKEMVQRKNCSLQVKEFGKPTDKQEYLFTNETERVGALRETYLDNPNIRKSRCGKKHYNQIYQPELEELTHGERHCYENGVAQCLGEWLAMEPSPDPKSHMLDFMKCNKNCEILGYVPEREFTTYRKYVRDNKKFRQIETKITGRRDQTIYCPKDLTFGKCSAERECIYDILTHKEAKEWIKQRRLLDAEICKELIEKFRKKKDHALTRSSELRSAWNHQIVHPPAESPREPTRLRRRAKPKISTTWDIEEAVSLLNCHPEADYRLKKFSLPSKHNLYYNKLHQPDVLDHVIKQPDERKNEIIKDCEGNTAETGNLNTGCQVGCKQCGTLQCCCATLEKPEQAAKNEAEALPSLAHQVLSKDRHVMFNDVVKEHD